MDKSNGDESNQSSPKSPQLKQQQQPQAQAQPQHKRRIMVSNNPENVIESPQSPITVPNSIGLDQAVKSSPDNNVTVVKKRVNKLFFS